MLGVDLLEGIDPGLAAKFKAIAPEAQVGTQEANDAMAKVMNGLDYDSSDGTPADTVGGKALDMNHGGRKILLDAKLKVAGVPEEDISSIGNGHFINVVKGMYAESMPDATLGEKIAQFRIDHPAPEAAVPA